MGGAGRGHGTAPARPADRGLRTHLCAQRPEAGPPARRSPLQGVADEPRLRIGSIGLAPESPGITKRETRMLNLKTWIAVAAAALLAAACAKKEEAPPAEAPPPAAEAPAAPAESSAPAEAPPAPDAATNSADDPQSGGDKVSP